uniref:Uncharacterized protein n=1 Tax=Setaria viridis TaxID=4556 RepID=A0A4U6WED1_SETVI|nr:hypothetical protein SEVIR_1G281100v2 [Setaria viridis]
MRFSGIRAEKRRPQPPRLDRSPHTSTELARRARHPLLLRSDHTSPIHPDQQCGRTRIEPRRPSVQTMTGRPGMGIGASTAVRPSPGLRMPDAPARMSPRTSSLARHTPRRFAAKIAGGAAAASVPFLAARRTHRLSGATETAMEAGVPMEPRLSGRIRAGLPGDAYGWRPRRGGKVSGTAHAGYGRVTGSGTKPKVSVPTAECAARVDAGEDACPVLRTLFSGGSASWWCDDG